MTATVQVDQEFAANLASELVQPLHSSSVPENDGTNACSVLAVKIADRLINWISQGCVDFNIIANMVDETIWHLPLLINKYRRLDKLYDILEVYKVLCEQNILSTRYDFSEELPFVDHVFSCGGRTKLYEILCTLSESKLIIYLE